MGLELDAAQRDQIVDEPRHAPRLLDHDLEEALAGLPVVAGSTLQRLDEAQQRGQRRAQLMADVGDEIDAHALDPLGLGEVAQHDQQQGLPAAGLSGADGRDPALEPAVDRDALEIGDGLRRACCYSGLNGLDEFRRADQERQRPVRFDGAEHLDRHGVHVAQARLAVDDEARVGEAGGDGDHAAVRPRRRGAVVGGLSGVIHDDSHKWSVHPRHPANGRM